MRKSNWIESPQIGINHGTNTSNHNPNCVCLKERFQVNLGINQMYPKYPNPSKLAIFWGPKHPCYTGSFTLPLMHHGIYFFSPNVWANLLLELADGFRGCIYYKIYVASKRNRHHHHQTLIWAQRTFSRPLHSVFCLCPVFVFKDSMNVSGNRKLNRDTHVNHFHLAARYLLLLNIISVLAILSWHISQRFPS